MREMNEANEANKINELTDILNECMHGWMSTTQTSPEFFEREC